MILSFADRETESVWARRHMRRFGPELQRMAHRKLLILDAAESLRDCNSPPGNRLETLEGDRLGQHSIRINNQHRICFVWTQSGPDKVQIVDYH